MHTRVPKCGAHTCTRTSFCAANRAVMWHLRMGWSLGLLSFAWEAVPSSSLLTCQSYGNSPTSVFSLYRLSLPLFCLLSVPLSLSLSLSTPFSLVVVTIPTVYRWILALATAGAAVGSDARSPEELQWRLILTSRLFLLLSPPVPLLPTHSSFHLHARVPLPMPGIRTQGQVRVEKEGAQLQPVSGGYGPACMDPTGWEPGAFA